MAAFVLPICRRAYDCILFIASIHSGKYLYYPVDDKMDGNMQPSFSKNMDTGIGGGSVYIFCQCDTGGIFTAGRESAAYYEINRQLLARRHAVRGFNGSGCGFGKDSFAPL